MAKTSPTGPIAPGGPDIQADGGTIGKGHPTPTRREKEAARKQPLVSSDRVAARKQARTQLQAERERARIGMAAGEEKFLPARDRGPQKRFVRDYVDARFSVGELLLPTMFLVIIVTTIPRAEIATIGLFALWGFFAIAVVDVVLLTFRLRRKLAAKFGADRVERIGWYAAMRALQLRMIRLPKPQVKRRQFPQ